MPPVSLALRSGKPVPSAVMRWGCFQSRRNLQEISRVPNFFRFYVKIFGGVYIYTYIWLSPFVTMVSSWRENAPKTSDDALWSLLLGRWDNPETDISGSMIWARRSLFNGFSVSKNSSNSLFGSFHVIESSAVNQDISTKLVPKSIEIVICWYREFLQRVSSPLTTCFRCVLAYMMGSMYSIYL